MSNTPNAPAKKQDAVMSMLTANWSTIKNVIPKHLTAERMARIAYAAISRSPQLAQCTPMSLANSVIEASMLGLEIGGPLGQAHLLPFNNRRNGTKEAQLVVGYKGFRELAYRSGHVTSFPAHAVFPGDTFEYCYGAKQTLEHRPAEAGRGAQLTHVYAVAFHNGSLLDFEVLTREACLRTKAKSPGANKSDSPWNDLTDTADGDGFIAMCCKTAVRRLAGRLPMSPDLQRAASLDEYADAGVSQGLAHIIDIQPSEQPSSTPDDKVSAAAKGSLPEERHDQPETASCPNKMDSDGNPVNVLLSVCDACKDKPTCPQWENK